ncbi:MAG: hypothetical protein AABZ39_11755 [Spirochaetota bacterium]
MTDCNLCRPVSPKSIKPELVIVIGNGAIRNGSMPLLRHFTSKRMYYTPREAITALGECTFLYKVARNNLLGELIKNDDISRINEYKNTIAEFFKFINGMAKQYKELYNELEFNVEIDSIKERMRGRTTGVVSTNWDECAWEMTLGDEYLFPNIIQIHGRCSDPASLILPTELTTDDEMKKVTDLIQDEKLKNDAYESIMTRLAMHGCEECITRRTLKSGRYLKEAHFAAIEWLESATDIVFWGIGFNAYDAELLAVVDEVFTHKKNEQVKVTVINTDVDTAILTGKLCAVPAVEWINPNSPRTVHTIEIKNVCENDTVSLNDYNI